MSLRVRRILVWKQLTRQRQRNIFGNNESNRQKSTGRSVIPSRRTTRRFVKRPPTTAAWHAFSCDWWHLQCHKGSCWCHNRGCCLDWREELGNYQNGSHICAFNGSGASQRKRFSCGWRRYGCGICCCK